PDDHTLSLHDALPIWRMRCAFLHHACDKSSKMKRECRSFPISESCEWKKLGDFSETRSSASKKWPQTSAAERSATSLGTSKRLIDRKSTRLNSSHSQI